MTQQPQKGYRFEDHLISKGVKAILGGIHPSILPEKALQDATSVVFGEGETKRKVVFE